MLQIVLQMKVIPLQRAATRSRGDDGLSGGHTVSTLVLLALMTTRRRMKRSEVVLDHVRHFVSIPVLLDIVVQICLNIAAVSVKPRLVLPLRLV